MESALALKKKERRREIEEEEQFVSEEAQQSADSKKRATISSQDDATTQLQVTNDLNLIQLQFVRGDFKVLGMFSENISINQVTLNKKLGIAEILFTPTLDSQLFYKSIKPMFLGRGELMMQKNLCFVTVMDQAHENNEVPDFQGTYGLIFDQQILMGWEFFKVGAFQRYAVRSFTYILANNSLILLKSDLNVKYWNLFGINEMEWMTDMINSNLNKVFSQYIKTPKKQNTGEEQKSDKPFEEIDPFVLLKNNYLVNSYSVVVYDKDGIGRTASCDLHICVFEKENNIYLEFLATHEPDQSTPAIAQEEKKLDLTKFYKKQKPEDEFFMRYYKK